MRNFNVFVPLKSNLIDLHLKRTRLPYGICNNGILIQSTDINKLLKLLPVKTHKLVNTEYSGFYNLVLELQQSGPVLPLSNIVGPNVVRPNIDKPKEFKFSDFPEQYEKLQKCAEVSSVNIVDDELHIVTKKLEITCEDSVYLLGPLTIIMSGNDFSVKCKSAIKRDTLFWNGSPAPCVKPDGTIVDPMIQSIVPLMAEGKFFNLFNLLIPTICYPNPLFRKEITKWPKSR